MADNTTLNPGVGGDVIVTEQPGGAGPKYPISKIYTGALDVNGGPVTSTNPFDVRISDATNTASVKAASTAPTASDKPLVVALSPNAAEQVGSSTALGALNAVASVNAAGFFGVGFFLTSGTLAATLTPELSFDGGTTWVATLFDNPATGQKSATLVLTNPNAAQGMSLIGSAGSSFYRVRVSAYTSGTATGTLRANDISDPSLLTTGPSNTVLPPVATQIGASDGTNLQFLRTSASTQAAGLQGLIVRPYVATDGTNLTPTMDVAARAAFMKLTDGTNTGAVKAASTAAVAADPSVVVALSPNNNTLANALLIKTTDGTNTAAVKAASTAAATTDPALVVSVSPNSPVTTIQATPTATLSNVAGSASSVTVLASNTARKGAIIVNDSTALLYLKFGTTASTTSYTVLLAASAYYEVPFGYTGILTGIWVSATGNARVTEIT